MINKLALKLYRLLESYLCKNQPLFVFNTATYIYCFDVNYNLKVIYKVDPEATFTDLSGNQVTLGSLVSPELSPNDLEDNILVNFLNLSQVPHHYAYIVKYQPNWEVSHG